jgi:hypothetical protein
VVKIVNASKGWYEAGAAVQRNGKVATVAATAHR